MKLAVIIPNYNHGHLLHRCLKSLMCQSQRPDEVVIVDDASTDDSRLIIEQLNLPCILRRIFLSENRGPSHAMNLAIMETEADYLFFLAADDTVSPAFLEKSFKVLEANPHAGLSCTQSIWREIPTGLSWTMGLRPRTNSQFVSPSELEQIEKLGTSMIPPGSVVFRRKALLEIGGFLEALQCSSDWYACYVAAFHWGVCYVPEPLTHFNISFESYYHRIRSNRQAFRTIIRALLDNLSACPQTEAVERIKRSGVLHRFGWPAAREIIFSRRHQKFLTGTYLKLALWHCIRLAIKPRLPRNLAKIYLSISGYAEIHSETIPSHSHEYP